MDTFIKCQSLVSHCLFCLLLKSKSALPVHPAGSAGTCAAQVSCLSNDPPSILHPLMESREDEQEVPLGAGKESPGAPEQQEASLWVGGSRIWAEPETAPLTSSSARGVWEVPAGLGSLPESLLLLSQWGFRELMFMTVWLDHRMPLLPPFCHQLGQDQAEGLSRPDRHWLVWWTWTRRGCPRGRRHQTPAIWERQ